MSLNATFKKRFQIVTHTLLITALALMIVAFVLQQISEYAEIGDTLVYAGVIVALLSTPIRLLGLTHSYYSQGEKRVAFSALLLVLILAGGAALKWFLL